MLPTCKSLLVELKLQPHRRPVAVEDRGACEVSRVRPASARAGGQRICWALALLGGKGLWTTGASAGARLVRV